MKIKHVHLLIIGVAIFFASCTKYPKNALVISKDASMVAVFDVKSLSKKAEFSKIKETALYKKMSAELKQEDKSMFSKLEEFISDPAVTGLDLTEDVFIFKLKLADNRDYIGASIAMDDAKKFTSYLDKLPALIKGSFKTKAEKDYTSATSSDASSTMLWNDDKLLILASIVEESKTAEDAKTFFNQDDKTSIVSNEKFNAFYKNKKDISIWASSNVISEIPMYGAILKETMADYADSYFHSYIAFEQNEVVWSFELNPNDKLRKRMDAAGIWKKGVAENTLQIIPAKAIAFIGAAYNTQKYYEFIKDQKQIKDVEPQIQAIVGYSLKNIITAFGGDFVMSFNGIEKKMVKKLEMKFDTITYEYTSDSVEKEENSVNFTTALSVTNEKLITSILTKFQLIDSAIANGPNPPKYYKFPMFLDIYYGFAKGNLLITSDKNLIENVCNGKSIGDNITKDEQGAELSKRACYGYANLNLDKYPATLKQSIESNKQAAKIFSILESATITTDGLYSASITLKLKNVKTNSLNTIFTCIDDTYQSVTNAK